MNDHTPQSKGADALHAYKLICPIHDHQLHIDLPGDFPQSGEVEVIILPLEERGSPEEPLPAGMWLQSLWGCVKDFPERLPDPPHAPVESL
jgi:hypothetical protein